MAAWGYNCYGQLGDNTTTTRLVPVAVNTTPLAAGQRFTRAASGSMAGTAWRWWPCRSRRSNYKCSGEPAH